MLRDAQWLEAATEGTKGRQLVSLIPAEPEMTLVWPCYSLGGYP